jgi:hypothetical protein
VTLFGELIKIVQKATVKNPSQLKGKDVNCYLVGNGQQLHFGYDGGKFPAPIYKVECITIPPTPQKQ